MKRLLFVVVAAVIAASFVATIVLAAVSNGDFETGSFGGWTQSTFTNAGLSAAHGAGGTDLSAVVGGPAVAPLSLADPNSNGALMFPAYGHYSARVNSEASYTGPPNYGQNGNTIVQTLSAYVDPSDGLSHVRFTYAAVMVQPASGHTTDQKPYFRVRAVNQSNGNDVLYDFVSYVGEPGKNWQAGPAFSGGGTWEYLPWNYIDLASGPGHPVNAGDSVMIQVDAAGCALGGHPGYAYVDEITDGDIAGPVLKATGPANVSSGGPITYTYNYKNGSGSSVDPTITAVQPAGVTFNSVSDTTNCSVAGGTATCNFTGVAPGSSGSFTVTGTVTAAGGAQVSHGNYYIAAAGFPTLGGQTVSSNVGAVVGTTTTVGSNANPSVSGQPVTFTATVSPASGVVTPDGNLQFVIDGSNFGAPQTLDASGMATVNTSGLAVGAPHTVAAQYLGSAGFSASNGSLAGGQTVNKAATTVTVGSSVNPTVSGQTFTATAVVSPAAPATGTPTGTVTLFLDGAAVCTNVTLTGGSASCQMTAGPGNHTVTAQYGGDNNFNGNSGALAGGQNVGAANSTVAVASSSNPSVAGQPVTFTATVSAVSPGTGTPTGTVQFVIDGANFSGPVTLNGGSAQVTTSALTEVNSPHSIVAQYSGDTNFNGSNGSASQSVTASGDFSISMTDGVTSTAAGSSVTYSIVVSNAGPSSISGATVTDTLPAEIAYATWTCTASAGSACGAASGSGGINQTVDLPVGGSATFALTATVKATVTGTVTNVATVDLPPGLSDPFTGNNSAGDVDTLTGPSYFVIDDVRLTEGNTGTTAFVFTVSKLGATGFPTAVSYHTVDGTATVADGDYQETGGILNFGPDDLTQTITVMVNGDTNVETDEIFTVHLLDNAVNALIQDADGIGKIVNDDGGATPTPTPSPTPGGSNRYEGDINRTAFGIAGFGDSDVTVGDQIQYQRFLSGVDCPDLDSGEQQRLDAGPRSTLGDGLIGSADGAAIDSYARHDAASDFDPNVENWQPTPAGGPTEITNLGCAQPPAPADSAVVVQPEPEATTAARVVSVVPTAAVGRDITVEIEMAAQGNEAGTQFSLHFDPTVLSISSVTGVDSNPDITFGADSPTGSSLDVNAGDAVKGNLGIVENFNRTSDSITALPAGARRIARVTFHVRSGAAAGESKLTFGDDVVKGTSADMYGITLGTSFDQNGKAIIPATPGVTVAGRVMSPDGRGVRNASVTIVDHSGIARTVTTGSFGYYTFDAVAPGESYRLTVSSRLYRFASRSIDITDSLAGVDFTGQE